MSRKLIIIGVILVLTELASRVSPWPSVIEHYQLLTQADEPYVKVVAYEGTSLASFIPMVIGVLLIIAGLVSAKMKEK